MDAATIQALHAAIAAACPDIVGVSVIDPAGRETWRIDFAPEATEEGRAAAQAALDAFDPDSSPVPTTVTALAFFSRFTDLERVAVQTAVNASPALGVGLVNGLAAGSIDLEGVAVAAWMAALMAAGALTEERSIAILTP